MRERLLRYWTYFRRGHNVYLMFTMSFLNFIVIQWSLLISGFEPLANLFQNLLLFSIVFIGLYIPSAAIIGWVDIKRAAFPMDRAVLSRADPWVRDLAMAIRLLAEGKNKEVAELMEKWIKKE